MCNGMRYVAAVLTIISAWRKAGSPRPAHETIVTFDGAWSDYCRYPLMWLGHADPATALLNQVKHDPDGDALGKLMTEWRTTFGSAATTIRRAVEAAEHGHPELLDAMREFPVEERGNINRSKLGWLLRKNANRIIGGFKFQQTEADGRTAWRVVAVGSPPSPVSPQPRNDAGKVSGSPKVTALWDSVRASHVGPTPDPLPVVDGGGVSTTRPVPVNQYPEDAF